MIPGRGGGRRWSVAGAFAMGMGVSWNIANVGALAEPVAAHYGVALATIGLFTTVLFAAEIVSMASVGVLVDRHGPRLMGMLALALCLVGNLATLAFGGIGVALALRFLIGLGVGVGFLGGTVYVRQAGGGALAQGLYGGLSLGTGGLAVAVTPALEGPLGWQAPFVGATASAVLGLAVLAAAPGVGPAPAATGPGVLRMFRSPLLLRFAGVHAATFGLGIVLSNWVVTLLVRRSGMDPEAAGAIGALILVMGVVGRPAGGLLAQRRPGATRGLLVATMLAGGGATAALGLGMPPVPAIAAAMIVGLAAGLPFGPVVAGLTRAFPGGPGAAFGAMNTYALIAIVAGTPLVGLTFSLPGDGSIGFLVAGGLWALTALAAPARRDLGVQEPAAER